MKNVNIGLIGFGTVGTGVIKILQKNATEILNKTGIKINLKKIADLDLKKDRGIKVDRHKLTKNALELIHDPAIDIIIELIGGKTKAKELILKALHHKKNVVTANKALLSEYGEEIFKAAQQNNKHIGFEASVGGSIPIIKAIREALIANKIKKIMGIVNGTTNFILTKMEEKNLDFNEALALAQQLGFAEKTDPSLDINGTDAAHKIQILASYAFNSHVNFDHIFYEGIEKIDLHDIHYVDELGYKIKLLAIVKAIDNNEIECRVHPTIIPENHLLASVKNEFNAVFIHGDATGPQVFYGKGAGSLPTASAIIADIVDIAKKMCYDDNLTTKRFFNSNLKLKVKHINNIECRYYLRFHTIDKPGVLAKIGSILGKNNISLCSVMQKETGAKVVPLILLTHLAKEKNIQNALKQIKQLNIIKKVPKLIRMENG